MSRPDIALRSLADTRRALLAWVGGVALLAAVLVAAYPSVRDQADELAKVIETYPDAMKAFFGLAGADYATAPGYLRGEVFGFTAPLLLIVLAVGRGASSIAGEEERGTLDLLLATPVTRARVVVEKAAAMVLYVAAVGAALAVSLAVAATAFGLDVALWRVAAAVLLAVLVATAFGAIALATGAWLGRRGVAVGVATGLAVAAYVLDSLAQVVGALAPWRWLSPVAYYRDTDPFGAGLGARGPLVLVALTAVAVAAAVVAFRRRDVRGG